MIINKINSLLQMPIKTIPILKPKIWGGRRLLSFGKSALSNGKIGESWEISTRKDESNIIVNNVFAGKTLREIVRRYPEEILGKKLASRGITEIPLLVKFLDVSDRLSVQVHPDNISAKRFGEPEGSKMEAWYILDRKPDSFILLGCKKDLTKSSFLNKLKSKPDSCWTLLKSDKRRFFLIPPGTLHSSGGGLTIFEVSENCDITYRVYDWDRKEGKERKCSIDKAVATIFRKDGRQKYTGLGKCLPARNSRKNRIVSSGKFSIEEIILNRSSYRFTLQTFAVLTVVSGQVQIKCSDKETEVLVGETVLLPAVLKKVEILSGLSSTMIVVKPGANI
ncbi:MAG: type I phosphomannose isomerase catalytic subunit [Planctomycetota bacterium]